MTTVITDYELSKACDDIAADIFDEFKTRHQDPEEPWAYDPEDYRDEMSDRAHEEADGHQWAIYTHYALSICAHCNTDDGEAFVDEVGAPSPFSLASAASMIVYGEIRARIDAELSNLIDNYEAPEEPEAPEDAVA